jgi:hypothetical protein
MSTSSSAAVALVVTMASIVAACSSDDAAPTPAAAATGSLSLDGGAVKIPKKNIGKVDLTKLPLGDGKYRTSPKRGYIYTCRQDYPPAPDNDTLAWVHGKTWNLKQKIFVQGSVRWADATFSSVFEGDVHRITGNDLPTTGRTGVFPPQAGTEAATVRPDPNTIEASDYSFDLPASPKLAAQPHCVYGEVGVLKDGTALFNALDANGRDAVAQEVQDHCDGHPNMFGYHRHWIPNCISDPGTGQSNLIGWAFDGFGIYGHRGANGKVLTNKDLDACHGTTSRVKWNGKWVRMYHYVATWEYPYTVGCFRGTPVVDGPAFG